MHHQEKPTYVLFGKEAIILYNTSLDRLLDEKNMHYCVAKFTNLKEFYAKAAKWDDFIEICGKDYLHIVSCINYPDDSISMKKKKSIFFKLFR